MNEVFKHARTTALTLVAFAGAFTLLMSIVFDSTKAPIEASEAAVRMALFAQIIPPNQHDNDVLKDTISIAPNSLLGNTQATLAHRARLKGVPQAVILEAIAHDGYSGDIKLLIAVRADGTLSGVRVIAHKETPGLGDYIDITRDNWIKLFDSESLTKTSSSEWKVKKDGGKFDYMAGATITPRAVVKAIYKALQYFEANKETLLKP